MYAIITENDESQWDDQTGVQYHFPKRYKNILTPGTNVIYYKSKLRNKAFEQQRKHSLQHYFGCAVVGKVWLDTTSHKEDYFAEIENYFEFDTPILTKHNNETLEIIPENKILNYWRDGVRKIDYEVFKTILALSNYSQTLNNQAASELQSYSEGDKKLVYTTRYERNPRLRKEVISQKGTTCICCGFNFEKAYGSIGAGFIHIHHTQPLHALDGIETQVTTDDLEPICPNCHAMIHRKKTSTLSIIELKELVAHYKK